MQFPEPERAIFLDRDGTVIEDTGYIANPDHIRPLPGALATLARLAQDGWKLMIISNQSGVGRGLISAQEMDAVHQRFLQLMADNGAPVTASYFCVHAPEAGCACRKPSPALIRAAVAEHGLTSPNYWLIGDRESDVLCGRNAGCRTIWLRNDFFPVAPGLADFTAARWEEIPQLLASGHRPL